jgi:serine/threonine protein kinase
VLVVIFLGGGLVLQRVLGPDDASVAFTVSTIGAALLFNPARRRAQRLIDRRFYGFRFDLDELHRAHQPPGVSSAGVAIGGTMGRYRIVRLLGRGGMGEVYQAERDGRSVALKMLPQEPGQRDFLKWFEREASALSTLVHPNIVRLHEVGESDGTHFMVLELIEGRELGQIMRERGRMPLDDVRLFLHDLTGALDYAHGRGLVHRDVKPSNIMIRPRADGTRLEAVLMDFGIAKTSDALTVRTSTGAIGTISYMAPEQIIAAAAVDRRADVYALGVTVMRCSPEAFRSRAARRTSCSLISNSGPPNRISSSLSCRPPSVGA